MNNQVNAIPFTTRLTYNVEEISIEEFLAAINKSSKIESEETHMKALKAKISQVHNCSKP
jgi:hypothetical protein